MAGLSPLFVDTSFVLALAIRRDAANRSALSWMARIADLGLRVVTTDAVCLEIGNGLSRLGTRSFAVNFLQRIHSDPTVRIVPLSESLYGRAFEVFRSRPDKEWGLTDCVSFVVMQDLGITDALTADRHFEQAGFTALLREV